MPATLWKPLTATSLIPVGIENAGAIYSGVWILRVEALCLLVSGVGIIAQHRVVRNIVHGGEKVNLRTIL